MNRDLEEKISLLKQYVEESQAIVFFGGAGVSTESGIPDFRSVDGLYHQEWKYPPETIISHSFFVKNPEEFYRFYRKKLLCPDAKPNAAHRKLAELEEAGKLTAVVTQNIDGLHQLAKMQLWQHHQAGCRALRGGSGRCDAPGSRACDRDGGHADHRRNLPGGLSGSRTD